MAKEKSKSKEKKSAKKKVEEVSASSLAAAIHETATGLYQTGAIDKQTLQEFDAVVEKVVPKKHSILPASFSKPIEELKRRVEFLEKTLERVLSLLEK